MQACLVRKKLAVTRAEKFPKGEKTSILSYLLASIQMRPIKSQNVFAERFQIINISLSFLFGKSDIKIMGVSVGIFLWEKTLMMGSDYGLETSPPLRGGGLPWEKNLLRIIRGMYPVLHPKHTLCKYERCKCIPHLIGSKSKEIGKQNWWADVALKMWRSCVWIFDPVRRFYSTPNPKARVNTTALRSPRCVGCGVHSQPLRRGASR